jgi:hypothetical protein
MAAEANTRALALAQELSRRIATWPAVEAVALAGSLASGRGDAASDLDLYVYTWADVPLAARQQLVAQLGGATQADLGLTFWGPGDEWFHAPSGIEVDLVYFDANWMQAQLRRVLRAHQPSLGYSTALWHTVRQSQALHDPRGWFQALQAEAQAPYPEPLRRAIIAYNYPVLRQVIPAYAHQLEKAFERRDLVSANHRLAALLASYFDILFALNRVPHPGEKRLLEQVLAQCPLQPEHLAADLEAVLASAADPACLGHLNRLLDRLDACLAANLANDSGP